MWILKGDSMSSSSTLSRSTDLPDLLRESRVQFDPNRTGEQMVRCPFHDDRNPSLSLNLSKGLWKCHSCDKGGDAVNWLVTSGYSKRDALNRVKPNAPKKEEVRRQTLTWTGPDGTATQTRVDYADDSKSIWWEKGAKPKRLLYLEAKPTADRDPSCLVFCEGAKAAAAAAKAGFAAVGIAAVDSPPDPDVLDWLHDRESDRRAWILWPDNDPSGRTRYADSLAPIACRRYGTAGGGTGPRAKGRCRGLLP